MRKINVYEGDSHFSRSVDSPVNEACSEEELSKEENEELATASCSWHGSLVYRWLLSVQMAP